MHECIKVSHGVQEFILVAVLLRIPNDSQSIPQGALCDGR